MRYNNGTKESFILSFSEMSLILSSLPKKNVIGFGKEFENISRGDQIYALNDLVKRGAVIMDGGAFRLTEPFSLIKKCIEESERSFVVRTSDESFRDTCIYIGKNYIVRATPSFVKQGSVSVSVFDADQFCPEDVFDDILPENSFAEIERPSCDTEIFRMMNEQLTDNDEITDVRLEFGAVFYDKNAARIGSLFVSVLPEGSYIIEYQREVLCDVIPYSRQEFLKKLNSFTEEKES